MDLPYKLRNKIVQRTEKDALRSLQLGTERIDFSSNDYLGFAKDESLFNQTHAYLKEHNYLENGAGGSRLLSGNHPLYPILETQLAQFYQSETALVFNNGYAANLGLISSISLRGDILLYDQFCHASIRDGLALGQGVSYKFKHNDLSDLKSLLTRHSAQNKEESTVYVLTESIFSMDGDQPDLEKMLALCKEFNAKLIVDEAHAVGAFGNGILPALGLSDQVFARIVTFGKGIGSHGAAVLGTAELKTYLVNFARSFIYSTALNPHTLANLICAHHRLNNTDATAELHKNINYFNKLTDSLGLSFIPSNSAIQCIVIPGNTTVNKIAQQLNREGFDIRPIRSPTVPIHTERLRFCLHNYNTPTQIKDALTLLKRALSDRNE